MKLREPKIKQRGDRITELAYVPPRCSKMQCAERIIFCVRYLSRHGVLRSYLGKDNKMVHTAGHHAVALGLGVDLGTFRSGEDSKGCVRIIGCSYGSRYIDSGETPAGA